MSFRQGLLRARGQIAFLAALVCSTGVIIYLEMLDVEGRIRDQTIASFALTGEHEIAPQLKGIAEVAANRAREDFEDKPMAAAGRAAVLNAAVLSIAQGSESATQGRSDAEEVLRALEGESPEQASAVAPALILLAAAVPDFGPRVLALLSPE